MSSSGAAVPHEQTVPAGSEVILERERELARIAEAIAAAGDGHGELLIVEGPAGIGKSRLLRAVCERSVATGATVLRASGRELEQQHPFGTILELFDSGVDPRSRNELTEAIAAIGRPRPDELAPLTTPHEFVLLRDAYAHLAALAQKHDLTVVVDDAQWADEQSLRTLLYVAERLERLPIALVVAVRTGDGVVDSALVARLLGMAGRLSLRPHPLTVAATRTLLSFDAPRLAASEPFARATWEVTGGNPFLLGELIAAVRSDVDPWGPDDVLRLQAFAPEAVSRTIVVRLNALGNDPTRLANALAILGDTSASGWVGSLAGITGARASAAAAKLLDSGIVAFGDDGTLSFTHPIFRSAVLNSIPPGARAGANLAAAQLVDANGGSAELVAQYLTEGPPTTERWAARALHEAGRSALRRGAPVAALDYLRRALAQSQRGDRDAALLLDLGLAEAAAGVPNSLDHLTDALELAGERTEHQRAIDALGQTQLRYGRHAEAAGTFRRGAEAFEARAPAIGRRFRCAEIIAGYMDPVRSADAIERLEEWAGTFAGRSARDLEERALLSLLANELAFKTPPATAAASLARDALQGGELQRENSWDGIPAIWALRALVECGEWDEALPMLDKAVDNAQRRGSILALGDAVSVRARANRGAGRLEAAIADARTAIETREHGFLYNVPAQEALLARCLLLRGKHAEAERVLLELDPATLNVHPGILIYLHVARAELLLRTNPAQALEELINSEAIAWAGGSNPSSLQWRPLAGLAAHAAGDTDMALRLIDEDVSLSKRFAVPVPLGVALHARGLVQGGRAGHAAVHQAIEVLERASAPIELAQALFTLGRFNGELGIEDPKQPLSRALDLAAMCGATQLESDVRAALVATGARPRRPRSSGPEALTSSERQIAELAASGLTNGQIAETLVVSEHTVKWHLRRVYRKLAIGSRDELASALASTVKAHPSQAQNP